MCSCFSSDIIYFIKEPEYFLQQTTLKIYNSQMKICQKMSCSKNFKPDYNAISSSYVI